MLLTSQFEIVPHVIKVYRCTYGMKEYSHLGLCDLMPLQFKRYHVLHELVCAKCRFGESDECAGAVSFLCSDDARYITGETIVISGGTQCRL